MNSPKNLPVPAQKRGGVRRAAPKKAPVISTPDLVLKDHKLPNACSEPLLKCRWILSTNFTASETLALGIFTQFIINNAKIFDTSRRFPLLGIFTNNADRAREWLDTFCKLLEWNDPECDLYPATVTIQKRVWADPTDALDVLQGCNLNRVICINLRATTVPHTTVTAGIVWPPLDWTPQIQLPTLLIPDTHPDLFESEAPYQKLLLEWLQADNAAIEHADPALAKIFAENDNLVFESLPAIVLIDLFIHAGIISSPKNTVKFLRDALALPQ